MQKKSILILGAGRSATALIAYLLDEKKAKEENWQVIIADCNRPSFIDKIEQADHGEFVHFNLQNQQDRHSLIARATLVISLLPPSLHDQIATLCIALEKHLFTASYTSHAMTALHETVLSKKLLFLNECGLDPGIDHMSTMRMIDSIRQQGGEIVSLESFAGAIIAPETAVDNPWRYKFTWNPKSVVTAGQGTAKFLHNGQYKLIPYWKLFKQTQKIIIPHHGDFVGYINRNSLKYIDLYGLAHIKTMIRGTLRAHGFCRAWNVFVQLGCTDDTYPLKQVDTMTHRDFIELFLPSRLSGTTAERIAAYIGLNPPCPELDLITWLGCLEEEKIGLGQGTPAEILIHILNKKWQLNPRDRDMVVMRLKCGYTHKEQYYERTATLIDIGDRQGNTAIAKGVGLPLAIATKLFLQGKIQQRGVCIPTDKTIYHPVLDELVSFGVKVQEETLPVVG